MPEDKKSALERILDSVQTVLVPQLTEVRGLCRELKQETMWTGGEIRDIWSHIHKELPALGERIAGLEVAVFRQRPRGGAAGGAAES